LSAVKKRQRSLRHRETDQPSTVIHEPKNPSRRSFLGKVGGVAAVAATASSIVLQPLLVEGFGGR
jgi:hypothetical protein